MKEPLHYIQDTRQHVGNSVLWWCPNGAGYTTHIDKAGKYTKAEARRTTQRHTDRLWPCSHVDKHWSHHVDMQHLNYDRSVLAARRPKKSKFKPKYEGVRTIIQARKEWQRLRDDPGGFDAMAECYLFDAFPRLREEKRGW